jgi:hypothetical protein
MILEYSLYKQKLEDFYLNMILQQNIEYYNKHGVGPYEYQGRFANRITPYLDAGYWLEYYKWLEAEYNAVVNNNNIAFPSEQSATFFMLRWS